MSQSDKEEEHQLQINEFQKKLHELVEYFLKEYTHITYAALIGVLTFQIHKLIERAYKQK